MKRSLLFLAALALLSWGETQIPCAWLMSSAAFAATNEGKALSGAKAKRGAKTIPARVQWTNPGRETVPLATYQTFQSQAAGCAVSYLLYLPPSYKTSPARRYPVVYWLHGSRGSVVVGGHFVQCLSNAIAAARAPEMIVVLVNGLPLGGYVDWADGSRPVQSVIIKDLIPHIDQTYRTIAAREGRAIEGFSMGGGGALRLGFKYPELFGAITSMSSGASNVTDAELKENEQFRLAFGGDKARFDADNVRLLARKNIASLKGRTLMRMMVGEADPHFADVKALYQNLTEAGLDISYETFPGIEHDYKKIYDAMGLRAFDFYEKAFPTGKSPAQRQKPTVN